MGEKQKRGPGRPAGPPYKVISGKLYDTQVDVLDGEAERRGISRHALVCEILTKWVRRTEQGRR